MLAPGEAATEFRSTSTSEVGFLTTPKWSYYIQSFRSAGRCQTPKELGQNYRKGTRNLVIMAKIILSINAGSSSVKVSVYSTTEGAQDPTQLAEAQVDGLTAPPPTLKYSRGEEKIKGKKLEEINSQEDAFNYILDHLTNDKGLPELSHRDDIGFACHRVVHGGDYPKAQLIDDDTYHHIEKLSDLAPLYVGFYSLMTLRVHNLHVLPCPFPRQALRVTILWRSQT